MAEHVRLTCTRQRHPIEPPLRNARGEYSEREGLLVAMSSADGLQGRGEAAPLPDFSSDTLVACENALLGLPAWQLGTLASLESAAEILQSVEACLPATLPAARFALETALLDRLGRKLRLPICSLLAALLGRTATPVALCVVLPDVEAADVVARVERDLARGIHTFKVKIGPERLSDSQRRILGQLRASFGSRLRLRLDANQSLSSGALVHELGELAAFEPEFIEEPAAAGVSELLAGPCPLALDESLQTLSARDLLTFLQRAERSVLVLKPTALGGFGRCLQLAALAWRLGREVVVSHCLEGPVGWAACAELALALGGPRAAGLYPWPHQAAPERVQLGRLELGSSAGLGLPS